MYKNKPLILSMNIQSLNSKFNELKLFLADFEKNGVNIVAVALQEIWQIQHDDLIQIPNYNFVYLQRNGMKGGGVGFYIKNDVKFKKIDRLSEMQNRVFECLTVEVNIDGKRLLLSSLYRSPSLLNEYTMGFLNRLENLLIQLNDVSVPFFIFLTQT
jgi:hypothetical protein